MSCVTYFFVILATISGRRMAAPKKNWLVTLLLGNANSSRRGTVNWLGRAGFRGVGRQIAGLSCRGGKAQRGCVFSSIVDCWKWGGAAKIAAAGVQFLCGIIVPAFSPLFAFMLFVLWVSAKTLFCPPSLNHEVTWGRISNKTEARRLFFCEMGLVKLRFRPFVYSSRHRRTLQYHIISRRG